MYAPLPPPPHHLPAIVAVPGKSSRVGGGGREAGKKGTGDGPRFIGSTITIRARRLYCSLGEN